MTKIFNDPSDFAEEALAGFCDVHSDLVRQVPGGAVRRFRLAKPKVAVLAGGGSGHYPAFAGLIGAGFADGAVVGNIFTSPSAQQAYAVAKAAESGAGVVFTYGNYAGDVMNFGMASERLAAEGIAVENVLVTDDIASAAPSESAKRRGIAGDFTVFKVMGAAAEGGADLAEVVRLGRKANELTRTIGSAFAGCTFPGAQSPLFTFSEGQMGLGLGIHGEPGLHDTDLPSAKDLGHELVARVLAETPPTAGKRIAVILNGLGSTKHEELFVLWGTVAPLLRAAGYTIVMPEVGELVTSLDMAGVSLTVTWLDEELEPLWAAPAETPAYRRGTAARETGALGAREVDDDGADQAGGTSGVLWGAGLRSFGETVGNSSAPEAAVLTAAVTAFADRIVQLGKAEIGDKTMVDALLPFASTFSRAVANGAEPGLAWQDAAREAAAAAEATSDLLPLKGRARPLAEKSLGTADPGATSLAMVFAVMGPHFTTNSTAPAGARQ